MSTRTLPRRRLAGAGWAHPYASPFVLYADGGDPPAGDPGTPPAPPTPTAPPAPQPPAAPPTGQDPADQIARLEKELAAARKEAGAARVNAKEQAAKEAREQLLKQLSGDAEQPLTPEQLQQQLAEARQQGTTAQQQAADTARELAVLRAAVKAGANAEALLDSRAFMAAVSGLDTADPAALAAAVEQQLTDAMAANPALAAAAPGPARSGPNTTPTGPAGTPPPRPTSLTQAVARRIGRG